jgi:hypothetical protein
MKKAKLDCEKWMEEGGVGWKMILHSQSAGLITY